jgi:hypothetical protein
MKYIKTYNLFEKVGYPQSIDKCVDYIIEYILKEYDKWFFRKGLANQTKYHEIILDDKIIDKNFPVKKIKSNLRFVVSEQFSSPSTSGFAMGYDDAEIEMEITIYTSKKDNSIDEETLKKEISETTTHEILHLFQNYKGKSRANMLGSYALYTTVLNFSSTNVDNTPGFRFLVTLYNITKRESAAELAALNKTGYSRLTIDEEKGFRKLYMLKDIANGNVTEIVKKLIDEKDGFDNEYYKKWIYYFIEEYEDNCEYYKEKTLQSIVNLKNKTLKDFVEFFVNKFQHRAKKVINKIDKIKYLNKVEL